MQIQGQDIFSAALNREVHYMAEKFEKKGSSGIDYKITSFLYYETCAISLSID